MLQKNVLLICVGAALLAHTHANFGKLLEAYQRDVDRRFDEAMEKQPLEASGPKPLSDKEFNRLVLPAKIHFLERVIFNYGVPLAVLAVGLDQIKGE